MMSPLCRAAGVLCVLVATAAAASAPQPANGVEVLTFDSPRRSSHSDSKIHVVRVDPRRAKMSLLSAEREGRSPAPDAVAWTRLYGALAVTNAGMFEPDGTTNGYSKSEGRPLTPRWRKDYRAVLVADPTDASLPKFQILDPDCDDVETLLPKYRIALQSIRMVTCNGRNTWQKDQKLWSVVIAAVDGKGRLLFIHSRSPHRMHDYINIVLALPLDVRRALYLEGGPEASLVVRQGATVLTRVGSYETGFNENDDNVDPWALPNILAIFPRKRGSE